MAQKKLPLINSAHGSDTRNIINELIKLFNQMGYTYDQAMAMAQDILDEAQLVNDRNTETNERLDTLILESGTSDAELIDARGEHSILRERFEDTENSLGLINDFVGSGLIDVNKMHPDFPLDIPFNVWLNRDGTFGNDFDVEIIKKKSTQIYLDWENGTNDGDGLSETTATRRLSDALRIANEHNSSDININIMNIHFPRNFFGDRTGGYEINDNKNVVISAFEGGKTYISSFERNDQLVWEVDGKSYKTERTTTGEVFDLSINMYKNLPYRLKEVDSATSVKNQAGTWYTDGVNVWVRLLDEREPDEYIGVMTSVNGLIFNLGNNSKLIFDGIGFYSRSSVLGTTNAVRVEGQQNSEVMFINSEFGVSSNNGLSTLDVDKVWLLNVKSYGNYKDGFNYHGSSTNKVFELNCEAWDNGGDEAGNNNGSSAHSGMSIVRFGTVAYDCDGPLIADVGDCYSIMYGCVGHSSRKLTKSNTKAGIFIGGSNPKAYLYNCGGGGVNTFSLSAGSDLTKINVRNFKGSDLHRYVKENLTKV